MNFKFTLALILLLSTTGLVKSQTVNNEPASAPVLTGDTLFIDGGLMIHVGQQLILGKGAEENGWYSTIGFKKGELSSPVLLSRKAELKNNYEYQADPQKRTN